MDPELDLLFQPQLERTISNASHCCRGPDTSRTSVLEVVGDGSPSWHGDLDCDSLRNFLAQMSTRTANEPGGPRVLRIFFVSAKRAAKSYHVHIDPDVLGLLREKAHMSERFLSDVYETEEWTRLDYGSAVRRGPQRDVRSLEVQYGFWSWDKDTGHSFVRFQTDFVTTTYFCINFHAETVDRVVDSVRRRPVCAKRLFHVDVLINDALLTNYRAAISSRNTQLISIEKETDSSGLVAQTKRLHGLSVNWHTIYKDLVDLEEQIQHFRAIYDEHVAAEGTESAAADENGKNVAFAGCGQSLAQIESRCRFYKRWAMTYWDRTTSRINLLHHLAMQQDNRLNQHIGNVTTQVALQTQRDSASMFTLAVVTTIFLPPTFVAGVFGTPFFNADSTGFDTWSSVWIYPAVAVPLTAVVLSVWLWWFRRRLRRDRSDIQRTQFDAGQMDPTRFAEDCASLRHLANSSSESGEKRAHDVTV